MANLTKYQREIIEDKAEDYISRRLTEYVDEVDIDQILDRMDIESKLDILIEGYLETVIDDIIERWC